MKAEIEPQRQRAALADAADCDELEGEDRDCDVLFGETATHSLKKEAAMGFGWNFVLGTILVEIGKSALWFLIGLAD